MKITKKQLLQLENGLTTEKLNKWFPDVFGVTLEAGKWYKQQVSEGTTLFLFNGSLGDSAACGFSTKGNWSYIGVHIDGDPIKKAANEEVFEALKNEAIKRGFVKGAWFKGMDNGEALEVTGIFEIIPEEDKSRGFGQTIFDDGGRNDIFRNGKWAEIIPTKTRKEAEELLGVKIID